MRSAILTVCLLALAGIPPTGGFIAKFGVFAAAIHSGYMSLAIVGILASLVSLYYYLRVIIALYMSDETSADLAPATKPAMLALLVCLVVILALGMFPGPLMNWIAAIL